MVLISFNCTYQDITSLENLLGAWKEFVQGKKNKKDVQEFQRNLMRNIIELYTDLSNKTYTHSKYEAFGISDPKPRSIHKASVRDRLLHHAIYRKMYPYFNKRFIADSYSCQLNKGTHKAVERFKRYAYKEGKNNKRTVWILKCDVKKFFASIDQCVLMNILGRYIKDVEVLQLIEKIVESFHSTEIGKGLPLGNLTSQLLVNIYMNEFDQWMKHKQKVIYYIRYADDFVVLNHNKKYLEELLMAIHKFLNHELRLFLHPDKVFIKTLASGVDFLGWIHFSDHRVFRTASKRRMFTNLKENKKPQALESYFGLLKHGNAKGLQGEIECLKDVPN